MLCAQALAAVLGRISSILKIASQCFEYSCPQYREYTCKAAMSRQTLIAGHRKGFKEQDVGVVMAAVDKPAVMLRPSYELA